MAWNNSQSSVMTDHFFKMTRHNYLEVVLDRSSVCKINWNLFNCICPRQKFLYLRTSSSNIISFNRLNIKSYSIERLFALFIWPICNSCFDLRYYQHEFAGMWKSTSCLTLHLMHNWCPSYYFRDFWKDIVFPIWINLWY